MSDETSIPAWGELLRGRVAELERQVKELADRPVQPVDQPPAPPAKQDAEESARREALAALEQELQSNQARLEKVRREAETAEARQTELGKQAADIKAEADKLALTRKVIERIWPTFMLSPAFAEWKAGIENALLQDVPPSSAALLFANLHGYTACLLESDLKYLRDVLRDISRFLYAWLKETGDDEHTAFGVAQTWAAAFNEECVGKCEIEVPEPGTPANSLSMTFPPRGSSPEVASVRTWCVRDAQKRVIHRAEVFT